MKTYLDCRTGRIAEATSTDALHHVVTIKDDFGNHLNTIHYSGVTREGVERDMERNFEPLKDNGRF